MLFLLVSAFVVMLLSAVFTPRHEIVALPPSYAPGFEPKPPASPATPTTQPAPPETARDKWTGGASSQSSMDDSPTVTFHLQAENQIQVWLGTKQPSLIVRCHERGTDVYMVTGTAAHVEYGAMDSATVQVRFDDAAATKQRWNESTDNEALFAPQPVAFARRIAKSNRLRLGFTPFNASPVVVEFDVRGFDQHIGEIAKACRWKQGA